LPWIARTCGGANNIFSEQTEVQIVIVTTNSINQNYFSSREQFVQGTRVEKSQYLDKAKRDLTHLKQPPPNMREIVY